MFCVLKPTYKTLSSTLKQMIAITEVPDLSHADVKLIFKDIDITLNVIALDAYCKGMNACSCSFL